MSKYEYKVVPAPKKGQRGKGLRSTESRFANALQVVMNEHGAEGWEYQRTDTLPCEERSGLTGKTNAFQNMLIFRRELGAMHETKTQTVAAPVERQPDPVKEPVDTNATQEAIKTPAIQNGFSTSRSDASALGGVTKDDTGQTGSTGDISQG